VSSIRAVSPNKETDMTTLSDYPDIPDCLKRSAAAENATETANVPPATAPLKPAQKIVRLECSACGAEGQGSCDCGAPYLQPADRAAKAIAANPEKSDRAIAAELGIGNKTVSRARNATVSPDTVQTRTGLDGKKRKMPAKPNKAAPTSAAAEKPSRNDLRIAATNEANRLAGALVKLNRKLALELFVYLNKPQPIDLPDRLLTALQSYLAPDSDESTTDGVAASAEARKAETADAEGAA
jgi:hypothetical protein